MQDTIILGNGTSKQIKTASLPNSYAEFKAMAENGNLFADISLNADGCEVVGTPLNKLNLLTDETAGKIGNPENIDKAIEKLHSTINGIPVDLTGIYNTQVIGYDETQRKLVPMTSGTVATQTIIPSGEVPRIWTIDSDFEIVDSEYPKIKTVQTPLTNNYLTIMQITLNKPYLLSEYTNLKTAQLSTNQAVNINQGFTCTPVFQISKKSDFSEIDLYYVGVGSGNASRPLAAQTLNIAELKGYYYIRILIEIKANDDEALTLFGNIEWYLSQLTLS